MKRMYCDGKTNERDADTVLLAGKVWDGMGY